MLHSTVRIIENINFRGWELVVAMSLTEHSGCRICCSKLFPNVVNNRKTHVIYIHLCYFWPASNLPTVLHCISFDKWCIIINLRFIISLSHWYLNLAFNYIFLYYLKFIYSDCSCSILLIAVMFTIFYLTTYSNFVSIILFFNTL